MMDCTRCWPICWLCLLQYEHVAVWICPVLSDQPRVQGLEVVCEPRVTQFSLPLSLLPPSSFTSSSCHLLSPVFACSLSSFVLPGTTISISPSYIYILLSFPLPCCLHLLSQGPCGTLRGWWGWGWWWCRWWWNSHSVSSLSVLELEASFLLLSCLHIFLYFPSFISKGKEWGLGGRWGERPPTKVSSTHLYAAHTTITPHMPPVFACVCLLPMCFPCCHCCLVWTSKTTNSNPNS